MILNVFRRKRREITEARPQIVSKSPVSNLLLFNHHTLFCTTKIFLNQGNCLFKICEISLRVCLNFVLRVEKHGFCNQMKEILRDILEVRADKFPQYGGKRRFCRPINEIFKHALSLNYRRKHNFDTIPCCDL